ncbi:DUF5694 domain-containing protein [Halomarina oriensis]|nr:DUF5694 domain-containing protein [Halomarina oriensis]
MDESSYTPWPEPHPNQTRVMLLGTYHMSNPEQDTVNVEADDVLTAERQRELRELADRLEQWEPHRVAVEMPYDRQDEVDTEYEEYRTGERQYDQEGRNEVVQVGYRQADRLGHEFVAAIDERPPDPEDDPFDDRDVDATRKRDVPLPDVGAMRREVDERLSESTIPEYHAWMNTEDELRANHDLMFDAGVRADPDDQFGSPVALAFWYDRNLRLVHHCWRTMAEDDDRILLVAGAGHVRVLRHLFDETPMFCPVSPRPYLPSAP